MARDARDEFYQTDFKSSRGLDRSAMDNNNSIPYGTISWDNEDRFSEGSPQRESQRNLNTRGSDHNGLRYSLRGPQLPAPQERLEGVGLSRQIGSTSPRQGQLETLQQPSTSRSSSSSNIQHERFFSLRPVLNTPQHVQMQSTPRLNSSPLSTEGQTFSIPCPNSLAGSSSSNNSRSVAVLSSPQFPTFSSAAVSFGSAYNNNNNVEVLHLQVLNSDRRSPDLFHTNRTKRKSSFSETEEGQDGPASKQFLSEERMAARMHNLRISNDHNYPVNIMQNFMDQFVTRQAAAGSSRSQFDDADDEFENNNETTQERQDNMPVFVLHPGVTDAFNASEANSIIPEAIYKQLSNPCLAVIPWKSPDEKLNFSVENKSEDQNKNENDIASSSSSSSCVSLIMENIPETEQFQDKGVHHVEIVGECSTFSLEDDDMEQ